VVFIMILNIFGAFAIEIAELQPHKFAPPDAGGVKEFEHGAVPDA